MNHCQNYLNKQANKWQDGVRWRWPNAAYTLVHKLAYLEREHYLMGRYSWSGVMHDWEKVFLYFTPWMGKEKIKSYHRKHSPHHVECPKRCLVEHMIQSYIDWDCAPLTKPDKNKTDIQAQRYSLPVSHFDKWRQASTKCDSDRAKRAATLAFLPQIEILGNLPLTFLGFFH